MAVMSFTWASAVGIVLSGILLAFPVPILKHAPKPEYFLYAASNSHADGKGIYLYQFNTLDVALTPRGRPSELAGVAALMKHPSNKFLYAATSGGSIASFAVHRENGALRLLNTVQSKGTSPCFGTVDRKGWMLLVANCGSGNAESFRVAGDGGIGESTGLQSQTEQAARPSRSITISPDNFFLFAPMLDKVLFYRFDPAHATFWPNEPAAVTVKSAKAESALAFRPDEKFAYAIDEAGSSITAFTYNREKGTLAAMESTSTLPGNPSGIEVDSAGRFLYVSNPGDNSVIVFSIDGKRGVLKIVQRIPAEGKKPCYLQIDPTGQFLFVANQESNRIVIFEIDRKRGSLTNTGKSAELPSPSCFQLVPASGPEIH